MYFCCPECDERNRSKEIFLQHAFDQHPKAKEYLQKFQIKEELLEEGEMKNDITEDYISVNCEHSDFHSFSRKGVWKKGLNHRRVRTQQLLPTELSKPLRLLPWTPNNGKLYMYIFIINEYIFE